MIEYTGTWYTGEHPSNPERLRLQVFSPDGPDHRDATEADLRAAGYVPAGEADQLREAIKDQARRYAAAGRLEDAENLEALLSVSPGEGGAS